MRSHKQFHRYCNISLGDVGNTLTFGTTQGLATGGGLFAGMSLGDSLGLDLGGSGAADAAVRAAELQLEGTKLGIDEIRAGREQSRADLSPFRQAGQAQLSGLNSLITDPNAQLSFIQDNPFFNALADQSTNRLLANQAAKGKIGSGETPAALQQNLLTIGNNLLGQNIAQRQNFANMGANAAAGQATVNQQTSAGISDLITQGANAQAGGVVGAANAKTNATNQLLQLLVTGGAIAASDQRLKRDIEQIGEYIGLPVYQFRYKWDDELHIGFMAHEVKALFPERVQEIDGYLHVNYGGHYAH